MKGWNRAMPWLALMPLYAGAAEAPASLPPPSLPLAPLLQAARTAIETCQANGYAVTVTVMDADGTLRLVLRADGARDYTLEIARRKAYTVIKTGMSSGEFGKTVPDTGPRPAPSAGPPSPPGPVNGDPNLITWAGGLPIRMHGAIVGAMSVSGAPGGEKDEACVKAGLAGLPQLDRP